MTKVDDLKSKYPIEEKIDECENYYDSYTNRLIVTRREMDCNSGHCSGCPYLINHNCELAESLMK